MRPVEARALHEQDARGFKELLEELAVVLDRVDLRIEPREHVERALGLDAGDARNLREELPGEVALNAQAAALADEVVDRLVAAERGLDRPLARHVGAELHVGEHVEALNEVAGGQLVARDDHPARTVAAGAVGLGERIERDREDVGGEARDGDVLRILVEDLVVDLVGEDDEAELAGDVDELEKRLLRIDGARRVVRVDDHDAAGPRGDLGADVVKIGLPTVLLVAEVVHGGAAREARGGCPERIVGHRNEEFVSFVEQRVRRERDEVRGAVAEINVVERHAPDAELLRVVHHGLAGGEDALAVGVARGVGQVEDHVSLDFLGDLEVERGEIADVELDELLALGLHLLGAVDDRAADVVEDVVELLGFLDELHEVFRRSFKRGKGRSSMAASNFKVYAQRRRRVREGGVLLAS